MRHKRREKKDRVKVLKGRKGGREEQRKEGREQEGRKERREVGRKEGRR